MTEPNGSTLQKSDPDEPGIGVGTMLQTARPRPQEPPETRGRTTIADGVAGRGVTVEAGEKQTAIDLQVVVAYGVSIREVAAEVRENVVAAVERMTGLEVVEVNIAVNDVHLPDEDTRETGEDRVLHSQGEQGQGFRPIAPS